MPVHSKKLPGLIYVILLGLILSALGGNISLAANSTSAVELKHDPKASLKVTISSLAPTRIAFGRYSIAEVIGDENKYKIIADSAGLNVFISPKSEVGSIIPVTIITSNNLVQDLILEVSGGKLLTHSIMINPSKMELNLDSHTKADATSMLKAMISEENKGGKYYISAGNRKLSIASLPGLRIVQDQTFRFGDLTGVRLVITNTKKDVVHLTEEMIGGIFKNIELVSVEKDVLTKNHSTKVFIITREEGL